MKLRNKKTGEIIETCEIFENLYGKIRIRKNGVESYDYEYDSLAELAEEWEDVPEEPKEYWAVDYIECGVDKLKYCPEDHAQDDFNKQIGNYFETREEAEKAVEKLKAWKRLKDKGFRIRRNNYNDGMMYLHIWNDTTDDPTPLDKNSETFKDLDLLFGGEE